ncbi:MAG: hypothetical protein IT266_05415 [Saprospiraceae bacterium]|nr:hypothetical protein [Saprospiraceae bacterium]
MEGWDETLELQQRILRYLNGEMDSGEREAMETQILKDGALRSEVDGYQKIMEGLEQWADKELRSAVRSTDRTLEAEGFFQDRAAKADQPVLAVLKKFKLHLAWAAALAILVIAAFLLRHHARSGDPMYDRFYRPDVAGAEALRDAWRSSALLPGELEQDTLVTALTLYTDGRYSESLKLIEALEPVGERGIAAGYFRALNLLALGRYAEAENLLKEQCANERSFVQENACWYYVLARLRREGKSEDLRLEVLRISNDVQSPRRKEAFELLMGW